MSTAIVVLPRRLDPSRVKAARLAAGFTQFDLAHASGLTITTVQRLETVPMNPRLETLTAIAAVLEICLDDLLTPAA